MEQVKKESTLEEKLVRCEKEKQDYLAGWQRARADLINYKKEEQERVAALLELGLEGFILKLLPMLDDLDKAIKETPENLKSEPTFKGLLQLQDKWQNFLKEQGIERLEVIGKKFDPNWHEAVDQVVKHGAESGTIVEEIAAGYTTNNRLLRPAKVKVAR